MAGYRPANRGNKSTGRIGSTVSRRLRKADWNISPSARRYLANGIFVSASGAEVTVLVDLGLLDRNRRAAEGIASEVAAWGQVSDFRSRTVRGSQGDVLGTAVFINFRYEACS